MKSEPRQLPSYPLRLEPETRTKLEAIAKANGRSLNAQIIMMLENALEHETANPLYIKLSPLNETEILIRRIAQEVVDERLAKAGIKLAD